MATCLIRGLLGDADNGFVAVGVEVGIDESVETGLVGVTDPLHPISPRIVSITRNTAPSKVRKAMSHSITITRSEKKSFRCP